MGRSTPYSPAFRARAVAEVRLARPRHASEWATIQAGAAAHTISAETLRTWIRQAEAIPADHARAELRRHQAEIRRLAYENGQLRLALDVLRTATTPPARTRPGSQVPGRPRRREQAAG